MKNFLSNVSQLIPRKKKSDSKVEPPNVRITTDKTLSVSEEFEINVKGIPTDLTPVEQKQILISLLRNGLSFSKDKEYQKGDNIYHGRASLNIKDKIYNLEYSITAMRALQALLVYKEAFDYVSQGAESGRFDPELADMAADFLKELAWKEVGGTPESSQPSITGIKSAEHSNQISSGKHASEKEGASGNK